MRFSRYRGTPFHETSWWMFRSSRFAPLADSPMDTPDLIHVALNDGGGPMARLVPVLQVQQWLESPDFFDEGPFGTKSGEA